MTPTSPFLSISWQGRRSQPIEGKEQLTRVIRARNESKRYALLGPFDDPRHIPPFGFSLADIGTVFQCDGQNPCAACRRLNRTECTFTPHPTDDDSPFRSSTTSQASGSKKRTEPSSTATRTSSSALASTVPEQSSSTASYFPQPGQDSPDKNVTLPDVKSEDVNAPRFAFAQKPDEVVDESADVHQMERMLEDRHGQLQYIGDSANLSFVQLLRMVVETICGPSAFTLDPDRHRTLETRSLPPGDGNIFHLLPTRDLADALVNAFFTNTFGLMQFFDEQTFNQSVDQCYKEVFATDRSWFAQFYMVLAIGFSLATPGPSNEEAEAIASIRSTHPFRSDEYFNAAKRLDDPMQDLDNANFQSVKLLALFALYMLCRSRRNAAYLLTGMAIRLSFSLGLHREETFVVFPEQEQNDRRNVWRSLYVMDCFLSISLGRPLAIGEVESASIQAHAAPDDMKFKGKATKFHTHICEPSLKATMRSCHFMGQVVRKVYYHRKVSLNTAQALASECRQWPKELPSYLHAHEASADDPRAAIAILHCNLLYCHSLLLLTRPFFLSLLSNEVQRDWLKMDVAPSQRPEDMKKLSDACIAAAMRTIPLVYHAYQGGYLSRLNPFATYSVFSAGLVISANEVTCSTTSPGALKAMVDAITILKYCGVEENQAERSAATLQALLDVIQKTSDRARMQLSYYEQKNVPGPPPPPTRPVPYLATSNSLFTNPVQQPFSPAGFSPATASASQLGEPWTSSNFESPPADSSASDFLDFDDFVPPALSEPLTSGVEDELSHDTIWNWPGSSSEGPAGHYPESDTFFRQLFPSADQQP